MVLLISNDIPIKYFSFRSIKTLAHALINFHSNFKFQISEQVIHLPIRDKFLMRSGIIFQCIEIENKILKKRKI